MKGIIQNRVSRYVVNFLLIQQFAWVGTSIASEDLSQTMGTLRASRSVTWRDEVNPDGKLQEEFDVASENVRFCSCLRNEYPRPSSMTCFVYRNMSDDSDLMQLSRERQRIKLEQFRVKKIEINEKILQEIAEEERRQVLQKINEDERNPKEMAAKLEHLSKLTVKKEMSVAAKKIEEEVVAYNVYAQILSDLSRSMGLQ